MHRKRGMYRRATVCGLVRAASDRCTNDSILVVLAPAASSHAAPDANAPWSPTTATGWSHLLCNIFWRVQLRLQGLHPCLQGLAQQHSTQRSSSARVDVCTDTVYRWGCRWMLHAMLLLV
jgi:hypothetical protein